AQRGGGGPGCRAARSSPPWCLKPALGLFEVPPVPPSLTEPVTLSGVPNSFCSALSDGSHLSFVLEILAPTEKLVSVGNRLKRSAWLLAQPLPCAVLASGRVSET